jgi:ferritin-like metal-binding protein YciE
MHKTKTMNGTNNRDSFAQQLQSLWSIEMMLEEAMPRMLQKAGSLGLQKNLALHFEETRQHRVAVEAICKGLNIDPKGGEPHAGLQQLLQKGEQLMMGKSTGDELDAMIIRTAQEIEGLEIAAYEPAGYAAKELGYEGIAKRLFLTLEEERQADTKLRFLEKAFFGKRADIGQQEVVPLSQVAG